MFSPVEKFFNVNYWIGFNPDLSLDLKESLTYEDNDRSFDSEEFLEKTKEVKRKSFSTFQKQDLVTYNAETDEISQLKKTVEELLKKNQNETDLLNTIAPILKKIANYSSRGVKFIVKGAEFTLNNLPREYKDPSRRLEEIVDLLSSHSKSYVDACKLIYISLNFLEHTKNTKLEMLLKCKLDEVAALEERIKAIPTHAQSTHQKLLKSKLEEDVQNYQKEIETIKNKLQKNLKTWNEKVIPTSLSALSVVLKLVRTNCDKKTRSYLSTLISFLTFSVDALGAYHGIKKLKKTLGKLWDYRNEVQALYTQIKHLEVAKKQFASTLGNYTACEKCVQTLKTRLIFLRNVQVRHQVEKLTINGLKFIKDTASVLGAIGALFVFTSVIAGAISTFAVWASVVCGIISGLIYLRDHPIKFYIFSNPEKLKEKLFSEIIAKRIEIKSIELTRDQILAKWNKLKDERENLLNENIKLLQMKNNLEKQSLTSGIYITIEQLNKQIAENIQQKFIPLEAQIGRFDDLRKEMELRIDQPTSELSRKLTELEDRCHINLFIDGSEQQSDLLNKQNDKKDIYENGNHSFHKEIDRKKEQEIDNKRKQTFAKDFGFKGTVEDYDHWAHELIVYIQDKGYREILKQVLGMELDENPKTAFHQIELFIRH